MERAARLSGARFAYLKGDLVLLELALVRWTLEKLRGHGFEPVIPPVLVREQALYGTGFLPDTEQQIYALPEDELYLVGTSEVALASLHAEEILDARGGCRCATPASRPASGARPARPGKTRAGIFRVHQFDKVEMFSFVSPADSPAEHERILAIEEEILGELELALPRRQHRRHRPRAARPRRSTTARRGCRASALPRADLLLEHDRLPGAAPEHPRARRAR